MIHYSYRFKKIAQLLFTSDINDNELSVAQKSIDVFDKVETDLTNWIDSIKKNLAVFTKYHGKETSLVTISEVFEETLEKQKQKYERMIAGIKQGIELLNNIQDVEMQDMVTNLTKASEEYSETYNELIDMTIKIGEAGFIQEFKDVSQKIVNGNKPLFEIIDRIKNYMVKNIMGEQRLS